MTYYPPEISLWFLIWFLGWTEAPESASSFDQQLQSANMYASIKNMRSFQERPKSFFLAKCLSSLYGVGTVRYKTPSSKLILNGDCVYSAKTWSCEVVGCHQISECNHILCCLRSSAFLIVDPTSHGQWHVFWVRSGKFAWLANHPSLATHTISTVEVVLASCHYCSSKPCLPFRPFGPRSLQQMQLPENYMQVWDS